LAHAANIQTPINHTGEFLETSAMLCITLRRFPEAVSKVIELTGLLYTQRKLCVLHQANGRPVDAPLKSPSPGKASVYTSDFGKVRQLSIRTMIVSLEACRMRSGL